MDDFEAAPPSVPSLGLASRGSMRERCFVAWTAYKYWPFLSLSCSQSGGNGGSGEVIGDAEVAREAARGGIGETLLLLSPIEVLTQA